ncbi:NADP-dependent oxidoreductase [Pedobacter alluvionis]|uniref:NADP-dependent oxidoreductase n=1 Tax=Pedobacter alluvionis TaxID=475253 RepID=A0A497YAT2_9SPHI|nr:NADP-dependent oxidoreductase [Pedobacter alluvionis]RLJ80673.1 NADPH:quinone reductase-like Zn-dependent oxidoreductase [Pedobacter alluvionis]TFB31927.1 NADP-dependent oxidoreductase [Pedobacter alluvionis]
MKAVRIHEFGGPEVLSIDEIPVPQPAPDEVLIKVHATSVNPVDWKIREGQRKEKFPGKLPLTLGWDVSGTIEALGEKVSAFRKGDEVYGRPDPTKNGAYAEYIVVKANIISIKPTSIGHTEAAAVPLAGLTAWQALFDHGLLKAGQKVLIHAAAGGVGTYAVQFAKWKGAYVIGTASSANIDFLKRLGADEVIDYKMEDFETALSDVDLVIDTIGGETQLKSLTILKDGGRVITTLMPEFVAEAKAKNVHLIGFMAQSIPDQLAEMATLIDSGKVKPIIEKVLPFTSARQAQTESEQGHTRGKIVLQVI